MTWSTPNPTALALQLEPDLARGWPDWRASGGLGYAVAGAWTWSSERLATERPRPQPAGSRLRAPADILQRMADAAQALGRDESEVWVEAAREWLARHDPTTSGGGPARHASPTACPPTAIHARRSRLWSDIDGVLGALRDERLAAESVSA